MKKIIWIIVAVLLIVVGFYIYSNKQNTSASSLIGLIFPPLPAGVDFVKSRTLDVGGSGNGAIEQVNTSSGQALLFQKIDSYKNNLTSWKVVDAILLPKFENDDYLAFYCGKLLGTPQRVMADAEVVAIVQKTNNPFWVNVKKAWRLNQKTNKIELISTAGLTCHNDILSPYLP